MNIDQYGQIILTQSDLCDLYLRDPDAKIKRCLVDNAFEISADLELENIPSISQYISQDISIEDFDSQLQSRWFMPKQYHEMDIAYWLLEQCKTDAERQRVGEELLLFLEKDLFTLLKYLKYLVDTMRKYNVVWGVGRGSSVSSYVLYLIGIHKINSLYFDLDVKEFLK